MVSMIINSNILGRMFNQFILDMFRNARSLGTAKTTNRKTHKNKVPFNSRKVYVGSNGRTIKSREGDNPTAAVQI